MPDTLIHKTQGFNDPIFAEVLEQIQDEIIIFSPDASGRSFIIKYLNKAVEQKQKVRREEVLGVSVGEAFHDKLHNGLLETLFRVQESGKAEHHITALHQDQSLSGWTDTLISKLSTGDLVAVSRDQTEMVQVQDSLEQSQLFFETVFNTIQDGLTVLDTQMRIIKMNQAMEQWYRPLMPYQGKKCHSTFHGQNEVCQDCPAMQALQTGKKHTVRVSRGGPMGTPGWIVLSAFPILDSHGKTIGVVEHVRNITEQKAMEVALLQSERKMQAIIEFLPDPTWVIDRQGVVIQWNQAIEQLTGIQSQDIVGKGDYEYALPFYNQRRPILIDLVLKPDRSYEATYPHLEKRGDLILSAEVRHQSLAGKEVFLSGVASPLFDTQGKVVGAIETLRDITDQKRAQHERESLIRDLQEALAKVRKLSGFLPICASCKKIRDDNGYWNQIDAYIREHSDAEFSHGLCPDCVDELYGDQDWFKNE